MNHEMTFRVLLRVIGSKVKARFILAVFGQEPWTNPLGFGSKVQICKKTFLYRKKDPRKDVLGWPLECLKANRKQNPWTKKNMGLTRLELGQNFKFGKKLSV